MSRRSAQFRLALGPAAVRAARGAVRRVLSSWGLRDEDWLSRAELVVAELVANAVCHAGGCRSVDVQAHQDHVIVVGVVDNSTVLPQRRDADPTDEGGRGLALVELLTVRWGVHSHDGGKRVWAQLPPHPG